MAIMTVPVGRLVETVRRAGAAGAAANAARACAESREAHAELEARLRELTPVRTTTRAA